MKKMNDIIINLINKNASVNEICSITGLSHKQLFYRMSMLRIKGYDFTKKYYYNGDIVYKLKKSVEKDNDTTIITRKSDTEFKALLISDLHLGNVYGRPDLLNEVYNFCIKKGINIIINAGDLVDGPKTCGNLHNKKILDIEKQIEYLLKVYPFDKNILNFICLGNHDYSCLQTEGLDLHKIFENKRHDLISLGYNNGVINIKNDKIGVLHSIDVDKCSNKKILLNLHGHSHKSKNQIFSRSVDLWIPSLTDLDVMDGKNLRKNFPSMILATFSFNKTGFFEEGNFEQFIFVNSELIKVNEFICNLLDGKNVYANNIKNEEERKALSKKDIDEVFEIRKMSEPNNEIVHNDNLSKNKSLKLTQVEKFNKKWSK